MTSIESIVNQAFDVIGFKRHIGNILEGSTHARIALNAWGQTRDNLLQKMRPDWSHKDAVLTLLKSAPAGGYAGVIWSSTYPEIPWLYEYQEPTDCVEPLQIKTTPLNVPIWRPRAVPFRVVYDAPSDNRNLLCNEPNAILVYVAQVFDPSDWHNDFIDAMIATLAEKFKIELGDKSMMREKQDANAAR